MKEAERLVDEVSASYKVLHSSEARGDADTADGEKGKKDESKDDGNESVNRSDEPPKRRQRTDSLQGPPSSPRTSINHDNHGYIFETMHFFFSPQPTLQQPAKQ